jgi:hypothetical protein
LLGDVAEVLEKPAAVLAANKPELAPCCGGRAADVAEAGPVADACEQGPDEERSDDSDGGFVDGRSHCAGDSADSVCWGKTLVWGPELDFGASK